MARLFGLDAAAIEVSSDPIHHLQGRILKTAATIRNSADLTGLTALLASMFASTDDGKQAFVFFI